MYLVRISPSDSTVVDHFTNYSKILLASSHCLPKLLHLNRIAMHTPKSLQTICELASKIFADMFLLWISPSDSTGIDHFTNYSQILLASSQSLDKLLHINTILMLTPKSGNKFASLRAKFLQTCFFV